MHSNVVIIMQENSIYVYIQYINIDIYIDIYLVGGVKMGKYFVHAYHQV